MKLFLMFKPFNDDKTLLTVLKEPENRANWQGKSIFLLQDPDLMCLLTWFT